MYKLFFQVYPYTSYVSGWGVSRQLERQYVETAMPASFQILIISPFMITLSHTVVEVVPLYGI